MTEKDIVTYSAEAIEQRINEVAIRKATAKIKAGRYSLFFIAMISGIPFSLFISQGGVNYYLLGTMTIFLLAFYISRTKPYIPFFIGAIFCCILFGIEIYSTFHLYKTFDGTSSFSAVFLTICLIVLMALSYFFIRGMSAAKKLDKYLSISNNKKRAIVPHRSF